MTEEISKAKQAYDLEVKENNVSDATAQYITLLEQECKQYREWWLNAAKERDNYKSDYETAEAEVDFYRSIIAHEFNRK